MKLTTAPRLMACAILASRFSTLFKPEIPNLNTSCLAFLKSNSSLFGLCFLLSYFL